MAQYSRQNSKNRPLFTTFLITILISIILFGFDSLSHGFVRSYVRTLASIFTRTVYGGIAAVDGSGILRSKQSLATENASLKAQLETHSEEELRFAQLESENETLAQMTHLATTSPGIAARVISSFRSSPYGTFLLGAGKSDGLMNGDVVLTPGGFALGTISDADLHSASVQSLFAPGNLVDLVVDDIAFSATGRGGGNAKGTIPRDAKVAVDDVITAPSLFGRAVGVIGSIESASSSATQTLYLRTPANLTTIQFLYVVHK